VEKGQIIENMSHRKIVNYDHTLQTTAGKLPFTFKERFTHLLPVLKMTTYLIRQAQTPYAPPPPPQVENMCPISMHNISVTGCGFVELNLTCVGIFLVCLYLYLYWERSWS
jgi:hypothetical protein